MDDASSVPPMAPPSMDDPSAMGQPMDEPNDMGGNEEGDDTVSLFNQLSDDDKEAARSYIQSMLKKDGGDEEGEEMPPMGDEQPMGNEQQPMMETVIFKKSQLKKINEVFGIENNERKEEDKPLDKKVSKSNKKSPFNSPKFN